MPSKTFCVTATKLFSALRFLCHGPNGKDMAELFIPLKRLWL